MIDVTPGAKKPEIAPKKRKTTSKIQKSRKSHVLGEFAAFAEAFVKRRHEELKSAIDRTEGSSAPLPALATGGSERMMMQKYGWYWEPLLHDVNFYEEMRDSIALLDGQIQKLIDTALSGMTLQCDEEYLDDLNAALLENPDVDFLETIRASAVDMYSLGNAYRIPIWGRDDKGRLIPKTFKPVRVSAMRKLRDENLVVEGYVQLLHRPSEFIASTKPPEIPTIWLKDEVLCGQMRTYGWYAYGKPLFASLPFIIRLKLTMERDLAEMLHQHVPRIDITFTPDDQMSQEAVDSATSDLESDISGLKPTDNYVHTPDVTFEYKGPLNKGLDYESNQDHTENQLFYVLPFSQALMGLDSQSTPIDSETRWKITTTIAEAVRAKIQVMFAPALKMISQDWGMETPIKISFSQLDPNSALQGAESDEMNINNANLKRDNGYIDQDTAAKLATANHKNGPVKKAAAPGALPPPIDPNKAPAASPGDGTTKPSDRKSKDRVNPKGPAKDGTKTPARDRRPRGKRHSFSDMEAEALSKLGY